MDFSKYTFTELNKIYYQLGIEYIKRIWWLIVLVILIAWVSYYKNILKKEKTETIKSCANCKHGTFPIYEACRYCGFENDESSVPTKWEEK